MSDDLVRRLRAKYSIVRREGPSDIFEAAANKIESLTVERDEARENHAKCHNKATMDALRSTIEQQAQQIAALREYARHNLSCAVFCGYEYPCNCGFDAVIAALKDAP